MAIDISYVNNYGYAIDQAGLKDNIKLVLNNAQKGNTPEAIVEQNISGTNSALLFEYTQGIAKSNVAQQLVLDANLKETLKFLNSQAAKRMLQSPKKKFGTYIEHIFTDNNTNDFKSSSEEKEENSIQDLMDFIEIEIDNSKVNIFAA